MATFKLEVQDEDLLQENAQLKLEHDLMKTLSEDFLKEKEQYKYQLFLLQEQVSRQQSQIEGLKCDLESANDAHSSEKADLLK